MYVGRDSSVGTVTRDGLESPGIESWLGRDRPHPSRVALGPIHPPVQWVLVFFFLGVKSMGRGINHLPRSTTEVKERLQQYLFSPSGPLFYCIQEW